MSIYQNFNETEFEHWIFEMDDKLKSFIQSLYGNIKNQLDYSIDSLDNAEMWLINTYKTPDAINAMHRAITIDGFCRYIGEVYIKKIGGQWQMSFVNAGAEQTGPYITGFESTGKTIAPLNLIKKALELKSGSFLKKQLLQLINK